MKPVKGDVEQAILEWCNPPPSTLHLYTAQSYAFKAMLIIITIIMILQKIVAPEQVKDK